MPNNFFLLPILTAYQGLDGCVFIRMKWYVPDEMAVAALKRSSMVVPLGWHQRQAPHRSFVRTSTLTSAK
jgi:hypothetical protein